MVRRALVAGGGGFIGHHLVGLLRAEGYWVRAVDLQEPAFEPTAAHEFLRLDLREFDNCDVATRDVDEVYQLAADMGGIGYISQYRADVSRNNVLINAHLLEASSQNDVNRYFFASSACVYPSYRQDAADVVPLKEEDAIPADPEEGYGWEKLFSEKLCEYFSSEGRIDTRVARFHNIYGPLGTYEGGREKAPAAICRKIALADHGDAIDVWGDGQQTRSFMYVDDCVEGILRIMRSDHRLPLNLGRDDLVTIDELVDTVASTAGKRIAKRYSSAAPQGVRGRNSDNSRLRDVLGWEPPTTLPEGLRPTYTWIHAQVRGEAPVGVVGGSLDGS